MPWSLLLNKNTLIIGAIIAAVIYHYSVIGIKNLKISNLTTTVAEQKVSIADYKINLGEAEGINKANDSVITEFQEDVVKLRKANKILLTGKNKELLRLKRIIGSLNEKINYPKEITMTDCVFKILEDTNGSVVFDSLSKIGE